MLITLAQWLQNLVARIRILSGVSVHHFPGSDGRFDSLAHRVVCGTCSD